MHSELRGPLGVPRIKKRAGRLQSKCPTAVLSLLDLYFSTFAEGSSIDDIMSFGRLDDQIRIN